MDKSIKVYTNDTRHYVQVLSIGGMVKRFAHFSKRHIVFKGAVGSTLRQTLTITQTKEFPFNITDVTAKEGDFFTYTLSELKDRTTRTYQLTVENTRKHPGNYGDTLILKTDSTIHKESTIRVIGKLAAK